MHRFLSRTRAIALVLSATLVLALPQGAAAFGFIEIYPGNIILEPMIPDYGGTPFLVPDPKPKPDTDGGPTLIPTPTETFYMTNIGGYMLPGEPNPDDLMTKTQWGGATVRRAGRVVVHTFGSKNFDTGGELNTVVAAYRGTSFANLALLKFNGDDVVNDNYVVSGFSTTQSLIQFDVAANTSYRIQIGGRNGAEGDIYASVFFFPPGGGLSAFLATYGGPSFEGRDYICELGGEFSGYFCNAAKFIIHNSTNKTLTVTPTTSLGGAFVNPVAFALAPGAVKTAEFTYNGAFNRTTLRTIAGAFTFIGRVGSTVVSRADVRGLISVKSQTGPGPNVLRASVQQQVRTGLISEGIPFDVKLTNTGAQAATGCHARSETYARLQTVWQEYDPGSIGTMRRETIGDPNVPVTIPAGGFKWLRVWVASQTPREGDPAFSGEIVIDCANTAQLAFNASNRFDLTTVGSFELTEVKVLPVSPTNGVLNVPASGEAKFRLSVTNSGPAAQMRVNGYYDGPFDDPANSQFVVTGICEANAAGGCIGARDGVLFYNAPQKVTKYFNVFVRAPTVNPGYDPTKRRVFLRIKQDAPANVSSDYVLVGTRGIAVKKL